MNPVKSSKAAQECSRQGASISRLDLGSARLPVTGLALIAMLAVCFLPLVSIAKTKSKSVAAPDPDYVNALATANRFLHAWQTQDHETGVILLTDSAKQHTSEDYIDVFFSPGESVEEGFEITRGKKLTSGRYRFPVALWQSIAGKNRKPHARFSEIIVVRSGKDEWAIDKLP
jgi:hypothetical protein